MLVKHFADIYSIKNGKRAKIFTESAMTILTKYHWPGNIRELKNIIERLGIMSSDQEIGAQDVSAVLSGALPQKLPEHDSLAFDDSISLKDQINKFEKDIILHVYEQYDGNVSKIAQVLQTDRANLHKKLKKYGIKP